MGSPAERFAAWTSTARRRRSELDTFTDATGFVLDDFQVRAAQALEDGSSVLVAAPTGAGKTIVGEFAVHLALAAGRKAFYTTPIKALSNQKYAELAARFGADRVGLLTGDTSLNGGAPVVVMTTEVLRNMLYADSPALAGLGHVVMDEVHYLADRFRGAVWEEVIIHLAEDVQLTSLSATVSNAEEFGAWLATVRGRTEIVVSEDRPVPLWQHVMVGTRLMDLFTDTTGAPVETVRGTAPVPVAPPAAAETGPVSMLRVNPELVRRSETGRSGRGGAPGQGSRSGSPGGSRGGPRGGPRGSRGGPGAGRGGPGGGAAARGGAAGRGGGAGAGRGSSGPSRAQVLERLDDAGLLPAIVFVFSRAGCDGAVRQCLAWGLRLTTEAERREIRAFVEARSTAIPDTDLAVLGYWDWLEGLSRGIAAHHAGMLPAFKEVVEELFSRGLVKAVFATETLALGINMPARSVVLEKLVKFNGESHVDITPGEYTQLTGRAGRRGIDVEGHAVVLWGAGLDAEALAGLASTRTYPLRSSFRPTYNMAVNLVAQVGRERAREILETSFAQFQADRGVVGLARQARSQAEALAGYQASAACHLGDMAEYMALRARISELEKATSRQAAAARRSQTIASLEALRPGDVIRVGAGRRPGLAVVLDPGISAGLEGPRPSVLTEGRQVRRLSLADVQAPVAPLGRVRVPARFDARSPVARRDLAASLRTALAPGAGEPESVRAPGRGAWGAAPDPAGGDELVRVRRQLRQHPCHGCPDRDDHVRWAQRAATLAREYAGVLSRIEGRTGSIARTFDRVCDLLVELGYLSRSGEASGQASGRRGELAVTDAGQLLRRVYTEKDLLVAQCLRQGTWSALDAAGLAAVASTLVYEARREEGPAPARLPGGAPLAAAVAATVATWSRLHDAETAAALPGTGEIDLGLVWPVHRWCRGASLDAVLDAGAADLAAGDFVRWCRQLLDLLDQVVVVAAASGDDTLARTARAALALIDRGVVAYSSTSARDTA